MEEEVIEQTFKEKALFYTTAFFVLLGTFSLFAFLFLVPFVIDPSFTTIFMEFDTSPTWCVTVEIERKLGVSNCSWSSCREGCTKELFKCTQILVNYRLNMSLDDVEEIGEEGSGMEDEVELTPKDLATLEEPEEKGSQPDRSLFEYDTFNESDWFIGARLFPNVKGCGYPPMLVCQDFEDLYATIGSNFTCYYSKIDPKIVITELDMDQVYLNLILAMAIPIPSFIVSCIYLWIAYFKIYAEDDEPQLDTILPSESVHSEANKDADGQAKAAEAEETKEQEATPNANSNATGNLTKSMTTSIPTLPGPIADV